MGRHVARRSLLVLAVLLTAGCTNPLARDDGRWQLDVTLGGLLPQDPAREDLRGAADLAISQINAADLGIRITFLTERARDADGRSAFDALASKGADAVLDLRGPVDANALADHAATKKRTLLLPGYANLSNASRGGYVVALAPSAAADAGALAALAEKQGAERVVIAAVSDLYGARASAPLSALLGAKVVGNVTFPTQNEQLAVSAGRQACASSPDTVILLAYPSDALRVLEGMRAGGCRDSARPIASATAFHLGLVLDPTDAKLAAGLGGVMPATARPTVFRSLFEAMYQQAPGPFAAETYDAVLYAALAAFNSHGGAGKATQRVAANVSAEDLRAKLVPVVGSPGTRYQDLRAAVASAKAGDDIDWQGLAHDLDLGEGGKPIDGAYVSWRAGEDGRAVLQGPV